MTVHLHTSLIKRFVDGDLPEDQLIQAALHMDECPSCAALCARMDPLVSELSLLADPSPPAGLSAAIVQAAQAPAPMERADIVIGMALLTVAAVLGVAVGDVWHPLISAGVLLRATWLGAGHVIGSTVLLGGGVAMSTAVAVGLGVVAAHLTRVERAS